MKTQIKVCGLRTPVEIEYANALRLSYAGFVFAPQSRRFIAPCDARALVAQCDEGVTTVGVFRDQSVEDVVAAQQASNVAYVQLHGHEDETYIAALRAQIRVPIIQAFITETPQDVARANASSADMVLLDGGAGQGKSFDYALLKFIARPYFLAGGLDPDNVYEAISDTHPFGVDVSSGVEVQGAKDYLRMAAFVGRVHRADDDERWGEE